MYISRENGPASAHPSQHPPNLNGERSSFRPHGPLPRSGTQSLFTHQPQPGHQHNQRLDSQDNSQRDKGAYNARHRPAYTATSTTTAAAAAASTTTTFAARRRRRKARGRAHARRVPARIAPRRLRADGEFVHARDEIVPAQRQTLLSEERVGRRSRRVACRAVMPVKPNLNIIHGRERRRRHVCEQFKRHRGRIVRDADPISPQGGQIREAKEGLELAVCAELDVDGGCCTV